MCIDVNVQLMSRIEDHCQATRQGANQTSPAVVNRYLDNIVMFLINVFTMMTGSI